MNNLPVTFTRCNAARLNPSGINDSRVIFTRRSAARLNPFGTNDSRVTFTRKNGFTLIEILVALAIIAIALGALIKASGNHTYSASYLKEKTLAHYVAMYELEKLRLDKDKDWPDIGTEKKSTEMADHEWYWSREVKEVAFNGETTDLLVDVSFTVYGDEDRTRNLAQAKTFLSRIDSATIALPNAPGQPPPAPGQ
jgi:type II secretion system protein I